jgi:hypothetical protein
MQPAPFAAGATQVAEIPDGVWPGQKPTPPTRGGRTDRISQCRMRGLRQGKLIGRAVAGGARS